MKRCAFLISIMAMFAAMFMLSSCEKNKLPEGTGSLAVHVSSPKYDCEVRVYPYVADDLPLPIASQSIKAGTSQTVTFTLNVGDYIVDCTGASVVGGNGGSSTTVQIHEGVGPHYISPENKTTSL